MQRSREDNTVGVIQRAVYHFGIRVISSTVNEALKSHPDYPTFKSICDTFNEWKIENHPLRYEIDELVNLQAPYIVHFNQSGGRIGFVTYTGHDHVTYYTSFNEKRKINKREFAKNCSGAVILINPDESSGEMDHSAKIKNEQINKSIIPLAILAILILIILSIDNHLVPGNDFNNKVILTLMFTKIVGIVLSILLILHEFEIHLSLTDRLCQFNKATNCNAVLHDKASKVFGWIGWADVGFVYFLGSFLFILQSPDEDGFSLMALLAALSVPYPLFSIYYQAFVIKRWCPLCLGVQLILLTELIIFLPQLLRLSFSLNSVAMLVFTFLAITVVYILYVLFQRERISKQFYFYKYLRFKNNPNILKTLLSNQIHYDIPFSENSLMFGDRNASIRITAFLSLHCSHCARAFEKVRNILRNERNILITLVLITKDNRILSALYNLNNQGKPTDSLKLLHQWFSSDPFSRTMLTEGLCFPEDIDISDVVVEENVRLFKECNVIGTPTFFINGYRIPYQYEVDDIRYFREVFKEREEVGLSTGVVI